MSIFSSNKDKEHVGLKIIIVGCGKVGSNLVSQLIAEGHEITVICVCSRRSIRLNGSIVNSQPTANQNLITNTNLRIA